MATDLTDLTSKVAALRVARGLETPPVETPALSAATVPVVEEEETSMEEELYELLDREAELQQDIVIMKRVKQLMDDLVVAMMMPSISTADKRVYHSRILRDLSYFGQIIEATEDGLSEIQSQVVAMDEQLQSLPK